LAYPIGFMFNPNPTQVLAVAVLWSAIPAVANVLFDGTFHAH